MRGPAVRHVLTDRAGKVNGADDGRGRHAGVDWSWETHAIRVVDGDGEVVRRSTVARSAAD